MTLLVSPLTLLITMDEVKEAQNKLLERRLLGENPEGVSDEELWEAKRIVDAVGKFLVCSSIYRSVSLFLFI